MTEHMHRQEQYGQSRGSMTTSGSEGGNLQKYHLHRSVNLPVRFWDRSLKNYQGDHSHALNAVIGGSSLLITGSCGVGKTHLAVGLLKQWFDAFKKKAYFLPAVELFLELKAGFDQGVSEKEVLDTYSGYDLLVIDDLGAEKISDWTRQIFYCLVDRRYRNLKQTIITSNLSLSELSEKFDDRVASRICEMGKVITLKGPDRRLGNKPNA